MDSLEAVGLLAKDEKTSLPLKNVSVTGFVQGCLLGLQSTLKYENTGSNPVEVLFRTPVEESFAVVGLTAVIDGRRINAEIREKGEAKVMYEDAITSGRSAALAEEKKGDIFSIVLGNLPPGKEAEVLLTMVGELEIDAEGNTRFVLPAVLKPRYTPVLSEDPLKPLPLSEENQDQIHHAKAPAVYKFDLNISGASDVSNVTSPSHHLKCTVENNITKVQLTDEGPVTKDIVILITPKYPHRPLVHVEPAVSNTKSSFMSNPAVMVSFFPEFKGDVTEVACELIFVVDRSGSMSGSYIKEAADTLMLFLKSLPEECHFNIIGFGSTYEKLFKESVPYNQENLDKAVAHASSLRADLGGTELYQPLQYIFKEPLIPHLTRQVFVLTDGSVSNTEQVIQLVKENSHKARCFSFGIGSGASTHLVRGIAEAGLGTAEFITSGERMQPKVIRSLKNAIQPAVTNTEVKFDLPLQYTTVPEHIPPIFIGERTIVYGVLLKSPVDMVPSGKKGSVTLKGKLLGEKIEHKMEFELPQQSEAQGIATIHHLAGKMLIKEAQRSDNVPKENIVKLSRESGVISKHTAFIAIDEEQKEPVKGSLDTFDVIAIQPQMDYLCFGAMNSLSSDLLGYDMDEDSDDECENCASLNSEDMEECLQLSKDTQALQDFDQEIFSSRSQSSGLPPPMAPMTLGSSLKGSTSNKQEKSMSPPVPVPVSRKPSDLISLQLANGSWKLSDKLAQLLGTTTDHLKKACPITCDVNTESIWATVIVLAYLESKMADTRDEWELVAAKAKKWLKKQPTPAGASLEDLDKKALETLQV